MAVAAERAALRSGVEVIVAPPLPAVGLVASRVKIPVFGQSVDLVSGEKTTGGVVPEALKASGASGCILNHSEARIPIGGLRGLVPRLSGLGMKSCVCVETTEEASKFSLLEPDILAVEPPELIGSGVSVSKNRPELVTRSLSAARRSGFAGKVLCGAGIVSGEDVRRAVELGADGVLVASSVVMARDWKSKILEMVESLQ